ncbi:MAG TPA: hypothetical protein VJN95_07315 [Gemmatimonadales bacterium]|nr:hypothetical protein [Gemmatimonadales bacterium]
MNLRLMLGVALLAGGLAPASRASAQTGDQAELSIKVGGKEIGHENLLIRPARPGRPVGDSLVSVARYPETNPELVVQGVLQQSVTGDPLTFSLDFQDRHQPQTILASVSRNRVTLRSVARGAEAARELPGGKLIVLLDDSLFATFLPLAHLAGETPRQVIAVFPRTGRRTTLMVGRTALATGRPDGAMMVVEMSGDPAGKLFLDGAGRFVRLEIPARQLEVTRLPR